MNLELLLRQYQSSPRIFSLADRLSFSQNQTIFLNNVYGSAAQFIAAAIYNHPSVEGCNHIFILNDAEEAAYFHNSFESINGELNIHYFPSSFKHPRNYKLLNPSHVMLRTEALTRFSMQMGQRVGALITYADALFEKVVVAKKLQGNVLLIKTNDTLDTESTLSFLVDLGFKRTDFVYEPGQFALRGGILDIYSFGNEKPYRIELFGNDVDSIRIFDPETQLSEKRLTQVSIIPNVDTHFQTDEKIPLFDFLPENTIVWVKDTAFVKERLQTMEEELEQFLILSENKSHYQEEENPLEKVNLTKQDFITASLLETQLTRYHIIEFGSTSFFKDKTPANHFLSIDFHTKRQPAFNRRFELLIDDLKKHQTEGYKAFLFSENPKQLERLHNIFSDLKAEIEFTPVPVAIHEGFIDHDLQLLCYTDHEIFQRYHKYKVKQAYNKSKALTIRALRELQPGDYVTHIDHGVGTYSGLQKIEVNGIMQEAVRLIYKDGDILYVNINSLHKISKYTGKEGTVPKINKIGSDAWQRLKEKTKTKVKEIAFDLIKLYAERKAQEGYAFAPDGYLQHELEASFIYEDTPDQGKATADVKKDMESPSPMDRLICGDVGFGKTEIAIRAAFKAVCDGKQVAVMVPTTILAFQHFKTFSDRLKDFPVTVDYVNRFKTTKEKKETYQKLNEAKIDIIIGTHALISKDVHFKNLGLLIVDEEQKFGVGHKEKIKTLKTNIDSLTLTATPIPRTLQFSLMGARDLSIINTPPSNRQPIQTEVRYFEEDFIRDAIYFETERGGQVFFIHNRVAGLAEMASILQRLCPDLSIGFAHGQLEGDQLEEKILDFIDKKYDVLVCTNIVESGVDIPNVNTIIVNNAHQFGLSDLHQLRGRVGRSNKKAFCYLLAPPISTLPADSRKRLQTLEQHSELGSGFQIAMRDLDIRGAGNLLGGEQSGFMAEIGFEMYQKILQEAIRELKRSKFRELFKEEIAEQENFVKDCVIDTDLEILIPDAYVESIPERLSLYSRLDNCENEEALNAFHQEMQDRFGAIPASVEDLFTTVRCRKLAVDIGFEKMTLKQNTLRCYFVNNPDSPYFESETFQKLLAFVQQYLTKAQLKQNGKLFSLLVEDIKGMKALHDLLQRMHTYQHQEVISQ